MKFIEGIMTTSFFLIPNAKKARCSAEVPLLQTKLNFEKSVVTQQFFDKIVTQRFVSDPTFLLSSL